MPRVNLHGIPAEVLWYVPEPSILLMGCRPLNPSLKPPEPCPVCAGEVEDIYDLVGEVPDKPTVVICLQCHAMEERHEWRCAKQRIEADIIRHGAENDAETEQNLAIAAINAHYVLTEAERRRIWYGSRSNRLAEKPGAHPSNLAAAGRKWLAEIGQMPDFSLILDKRGRVVGRFSVDPIEPV